jgi:hypothetical protein
MKALIFLIAILLTASTAPAQKTVKENVLTKYKANQTGIISQQGGLAIVYQPPPEGTQMVLANRLDSSKPIYYSYYSVSNKPSQLYVLKPEYQFKFNLVTESGVNVKPTRVGANYGMRFAELNTVVPAAIEMNNRGTPMHDIALLPDLSSGYGPSIPAPEKLFSLKKPGKYTMTIEAACFASKDYPPGNRGPLISNYSLVQFPPVKLTIIKKE